MSILCLITHKWEYNVENITFVRRKSGSHLRDTAVYPTEVRLCLRCNKKQRKRVTDWNDTYLTVEDEREIKLRKLI